MFRKWKAGQITDDKNKSYEWKKKKKIEGQDANEMQLAKRQKNDKKSLFKYKRKTRESAVLLLIKKEIYAQITQRRLWLLMTFLYLSAVKTSIKEKCLA